MITGTFGEPILRAYGNNIWPILIAINQSLIFSIMRPSTSIAALRSIVWILFGLSVEQRVASNPIIISLVFVIDTPQSHLSVEHILV